MTAFPLEWHRICLKNMGKNLAREEAELLRKQAQVDRSRAEVEHLGVQIEKAERTGLTKFDSEKYMKKKPR